MCAIRFGTSFRFGLLLVLVVNLASAEKWVWSDKLQDRADKGPAKGGSPGSGSKTTNRKPLQDELDDLQNDEPRRDVYDPRYQVTEAGQGGFPFPQGVNNRYPPNLGVSGTGFAGPGTPVLVGPSAYARPQYPQGQYPGGPQVFPGAVGQYPRPDIYPQRPQGSRYPTGGYPGNTGGYGLAQVGGPVRGPIGGPIGGQIGGPIRGPIGGQLAGYGGQIGGPIGGQLGGYGGGYGGAYGGGYASGYGDGYESSYGGGYGGGYGGVYGGDYERGYEQNYGAGIGGRPAVTGHPANGVLVGPGGPTGLIGRPNRRPTGLIGNGGINPNRGVLIGPGGPFDNLGPIGKGPGAYGRRGIYPQQDESPQRSA